MYVTFLGQQLSWRKLPDFEAGYVWYFLGANADEGWLCRLATGKVCDGRSHTESQSGRRRVQREITHHIQYKYTQLLEYAMLSVCFPRF